MGIKTRTSHQKKRCKKNIFQGRTNARNITLSTDKRYLPIKYTYTSYTVYHTFFNPSLDLADLSALPENAPPSTRLRIATHALTNLTFRGLGVFYFLTHISPTTH